jgi:hypothetical protein
MGAARRAIETTGVIDAGRQLHLDGPLAGIGPGRVRIIILESDELAADEIEWLKAAATSSAFDFLRDPAEDIYTAADGRPLGDPR